MHLSENADAPGRVGYSLGNVSESDIDCVILPDMIEDDDLKVKEFTSAFVLAKFRRLGWPWANQVAAEKWSKEQIGIFFSYLPSTQNTWDSVGRLLGEDEIEYWKRAAASAYVESENLDYAIDKLIRYKRPNAAITYLYLGLHKKSKLNKILAIKALKDAVTTEEPPYAFDTFQIVEVIKALQNDPEVSPDDLFDVEWAYLQLLTGPGNTGTPESLEIKLATEPNFFCELIRRIYRSKYERKTKKETTEQEKAIATKAWLLFRIWKRIPGITENNNFSTKQFKEWLLKVKTTCGESGHFDAAMNTLGEALIHSPSDPDGLWIHRTVAEALNEEDAEQIRIGYYRGIINARGSHWVDPSGKPEKELAEKYRRQADGIEDAGYFRFAQTLRKLAKIYEEEAKRIIEDYKKE